MNPSRSSDDPIPTDMAQVRRSTPEPVFVESPLQRQILLWQRELLRRREARERQKN